MKKPDRSLVPGLLVLGLIAAVVHWRYRPPVALPVDAPAEQFSAGRAMEVLRRILGDEAPHPIGSPANHAVRARIFKEFEGLGYSPRVDTRFACNDHGNCGLTRNVVAELPGKREGPWLLLATHHDSRAAAPGAADAGAGVAALLEVARILKAGPPLEHPVRFWIDDGEEVGLLGAHAYVDEAGRAEETHAVINLEARGTGGMSLMFETSAPNLHLLEAFAAGASRPQATSLFFTVYRFLPNDTDLTILKRAGIPGFGFAFIGRPMQYHTPADRLEHLDPRSLQHHGDQALALLRALDRVEETRVRGDNAVYFDLLAEAVVFWPNRWNRVLAVANLLLWLGLLVAAVRRGWTSVGGLVLGVLVWLGVMGLAAGAGYGLHRLLRHLGSVPGKWVAHPYPALIANWALALLLVFGLTSVTEERVGPWGLWFAWWGGMACDAAGTAFYFPGCSYLLLVPSLVAGLATMADLRSPKGTRDGPRLGTSLTPLFVLGILFLPLQRLFLDGLGFWIPAVHTLCGALTFGAVASRGGKAHRALYLAGGALLVWALARAAYVGPYTEAHPRQMVFHLHHDSEKGESEWLAVAEFGPLPPAVLELAPFEPSPGTSRELKARHPVHRAPAPDPGLAAPDVRGAAFQPEGEGGVFRARLHSNRGAWQFGFRLAAGLPVTSLKVRGKTQWEAKTPGAPFPGRRASVWVDAGGEVDVEVRFHARPEGALRFWDETIGLPPTGDALVAARPATAAPAHQGDRTRVFAEVPWVPAGP